MIPVLREACYKSVSDSHLQEAVDQASAWTVKNDMQTLTKQST